MTIDLKDWQIRKTKIEWHGKQIERAAGAAEQLKGQLQSDFACAKTSQARLLMEKMTKDLSAVEKEYVEAVEVFDEQHADKLS